VLWTVLAINFALFCVEFVAGSLGGSSALLGDSLDMLGDAFVYGASLYVLASGARTQANVAVGKGLLMGVLALAVVADAVSSLMSAAPPSSALVGSVGVLALAGNGASFALLYRYRGDNLNFRSTWLCSRNDLIANIAVLTSAAVVAVTASRWPDAVVGVGLALLWIRTALRVLGEARAELGAHPAEASSTGIGR
jgi:Co/Zn/Cd efflux system component